MFRTAATWILVATMVLSAPLQAGVVQVKVDDQRNRFGQIESWTGAGSLTPSLLSVFTAPSGDRVVMRIQQGMLQVTLPSSSFTLSTDGSLVHLSRSVGGVTSMEIMSEAEIAAKRTQVAKQITSEEIATSNIPLADKRVLADLQTFLDQTPSAKMIMSGQCWIELLLLYAGTIGTVAGCVVTGGLGCFLGGVGLLLAWSAWERDCGPDAGYGLGPTSEGIRP